MPAEFKLSHQPLDITNPPFHQAVVVHSCNCLGDWGAGVALALKKKFPAAYAVHEAYCKEKGREELIGTCQLIRPQESDYANEKKTGSTSRPKKRKADALEDGGGRHAASGPDDGDEKSHQKRTWIACIFTSVGYGKGNKKKGNPGKDKPDKILAQTRDALIDLRTQLNELNEHEGENDKPGVIVACKFNSGYFGVDWEDSEKVIYDVFADTSSEWIIADGEVEAVRGNKRSKR